MNNPVWRRSSLCADGSCVEVAAIGDKIAFGKGEDGHVSPRVLYTHAEMAAFIAGVKAGDFDDLCAGVSL